MWLVSLHNEHAFVKLITEAGLEGVGECWWRQDYNTNAFSHGV
jgi:hypothetical protein